MSTITKEWLQQKIADMEATRDEIPFGLDEDESNTLAALRIALASSKAEPVEPICGATKYPVSRPLPGAKLIVWDEVGRFVGYGSAVDTRDSGIAIQMSDGRLFDSNHELRWQYALQPAPVSLTEEQRSMLRDIDNQIVAELEEEERACLATMLQGAEPSKMSGIMPDYEGGVMTQRECFRAGWEAHHAAMLRAGAPVQFGWSKGHFGYHTLFNAIGKAVNIQGGALSISVSAFEDAMLEAAPQQEGL
ncbi:hypothetical protein [Enterobacter cloacae]